MNTPRPAGAPDHSSLLGLLMASVRVEFRSDVLTFAAEDPVFGGGACTVASCERSARSFGLCQGHHQRWNRQGRPDLETYAATTDSHWKRQRPNRVCRVAACGYGSARSGLCSLHGQRWIRMGRPDLDRWLIAPPPVKQPEPSVTCLIAHCELWPRADHPFCHAHTQTWWANDRPEPALFAEDFGKERICADEIIQLGSLAPQMKLEIQYALQQRHDERASKTPPSVVMQLVRFLAGTPQSSLLEASEEQWRRRIGRPAPKDGAPRALLGYARRVLEDLVSAAMECSRRAASRVQADGHRKSRWTACCS